MATEKRPGREKAPAEEQAEKRRAETEEEADLKRREYRDEKGEIHHHTKKYMEQHEKK